MIFDLDRNLARWYILTEFDGQGYRSLFKVAEGKCRVGAFWLIDTAD